MRSGSLRTRVILTTLPLLASVMIAVVAAVTLIYRASLYRDLRHRLSSAAAGMQYEWPQSGKQVIAALALEGIAGDIHANAQPPPAGKVAATETPPIKVDSTIHTRGSLLVLDQTLSDGTRITYTASRQPIARSVRRLLLIQLGVAIGALALAALLLTRGARAALQPLADVAETARRIAAGDRTRRLRPDRPDTELGSMATAFDEMVDALDGAIERATAAESSTLTFLAEASHELRTPIASLQATAETLLREQPERPDRDHIEAMLARDAARLGRLVDDLLTLTRLEGDAHPHALVDLSAAVAEAVDGLKVRAPGVSVRLEASAEVLVRGDAPALTRALRNLLDNAVAAGANEITIEMGCVNGCCEVGVLDNGSGVPHHERERIFERFTRLDDSRPGHGLGLAIARRIARQHDGTLTCEPAPRGAHFRLRIPVARRDESPAPNSSNVKAATAATPNARGGRR